MGLIHIEIHKEKKTDIKAQKLQDEQKKFEWREGERKGCRDKDIIYGFRWHISQCF